MPLVLLFLVLAGILLPPAWATSGQDWRDTKPEDFVKGNLEGVTLSIAGELAIAPRRTVVLKDDRVALVWALAVDSKGTIYAATGHQGLLFKISNEKSEVVWDAEDPEVMSLTVDGQDNVFAATSPGGHIFQITAQGNSQLYASTGQTYVWAMAASPEGELYAATGPEGKILKIGQDRTVSTFYDSQDPHVLCMVRGRDGVLYAGTAGRGLVLSIDQGKAKTMYDAEQGEIRCLTLDDSGHLFFGTASGALVVTPAAQPPKGEPAGPAGGQGAEAGGASTPSGPLSPGDPQPSEGGGIEAKARSSVPRTMQRGQADSGIVVQKTNGVYRDDKDGHFRRIFSLHGGLFYSLVALEAHIYAGTGPGFGLFRLRHDAEAVQIMDGTEANILALARGKGGSVLVSTATPGLVYQLSPGYQEKGLFWSDVKDGGQISRFGQISWRGSVPPGTQVTLSTRSGNVAEPDETWSAWSEEFVQPEGQPVSSPPARFFQYRATLTTTQGEATPRLHEVHITYIQNNLPPQITRFQIGGVQPEAGKKSEAEGEKEKDKKAQKPQAENPSGLPSPVIIEPDLGTALRSVSDLTWSATDPNSDTLSYTFSFRLKDDPLWKPIVKRAKETTYKWDTLLLPDGWYELQLLVDDQESNPELRSLRTEIITPLVLLDNSGPGIPEIRQTPVVDGACSIRVVLQDQFIHVAAVYYSIDGKAWESLPALDDIFDSSKEEVEIELRDLKPGIHTVSILAKDKAGNASIRKFPFPSPEKK